MMNFNTFDTKGYLQDFVMDTRGDSLHDQLIGTLELQDLNKKLLTVFLDIDMALMAYQNHNLMVIFTQNFSKGYDMIPDIVHTVVKRKIDEYSESEELKKIALYHLESLTLHVELKISHFPVIYDSISTRVLEINSGIMKEGHLAGIKKMGILTVYDSSLYLLSRKYVSECDGYPEKAEINRVYKNPLNILKKEGFFNPMPTGSNFHYKFIRGKEEILCDRGEIPYKVKDSEDIYIEGKIAEGIPIDKRGRPINSGSERINIWFQAPFQDYIKEGQTLSITGYYYAIPNFHWKKEGGGKVGYPLRIGGAAFNFCPFIENEIDIAIMDELEGASSLLTSDLNLTNLLNEPTQNLHLISRIKRHQKDRNNLISKLTQNQSVSSVPLSFAHITDVFGENPELADKENVEKWTDTEMISKKLNADMIAIRNLVKFIFNDKEYYTEDKKAYLYLFHFKLAMLLSIISLHSPVIETSCSDTTSVDSFALSSLASISTVDLDSNFSHINYTSSLLNLLLISDDTSHLLKLIKSTEQLGEGVSLPAAIDAASLETFLKVNKDKIILVHFSYFKWGAQMRKIFHQILYRNQRGLKVKLILEEF